MSAATDHHHSWRVRATLETDADIVRLIIAGRLGTAGAVDLRSALAAAIAGGGRVQVDLSCVDYISSAGLAVLDEMAQRLRKAGGMLDVVDASEAVKLALRLAGAEPPTRY